MQKNVLSVVSIELQKDKNGQEYKKVGYEPFDATAGDVLVETPTRYRNMFQDSKDENGNTIKGSSLYNKIAVGSKVAAEIVTLPTTPNTLPSGNVVTTWTGVIFSTENKYTVCNRNLRDNNANVIDETTGEIVPHPERATAVKKATTSIPVMTEETVEED